MNSAHWIAEIYSAHADLWELHTRRREDDETTADLVRAKIIAGALAEKFGAAAAARGYRDYLADVEGRVRARRAAPAGGAPW